MPKANKIKEKRDTKKSPTEMLQKEMLEYYKDINTKRKKQENKNRRFEKNKVKGCLIIYGIPLIISIIFTVLYNFLILGYWSWIISFFIFFISAIFSNMLMDFIITKNEDRYINWMKLMFEIFTIVILMGQLLVASGQNSIQQKQNEILQQTSQSTKADLLLVSSQGNTAYRYENLREEKSPQIAVAVTNLGKATAPFVIVSMNSSFFNGYKLDTSDGRVNFILQDLKSLDYNATFFKFWVNPDIETNFTFGITDIIFKIECAYCLKPVDYQKIPICVYKEDRIRECGAEWK